MIYIIYISYIYIIYIIVNILLCYIQYKFLPQPYAIGSLLFCIHFIDLKPEARYLASCLTSYRHK